MGIEQRLSKITYQEKKNKSVLPVYNDEGKIKAIQSLYDAAINDDTVIDVAAVFPRTAIGATIEWDAGNKKMVIEAGLRVVYDDLTDATTPESMDTNIGGALMVEGEYFILTNGQLLIVDYDPGSENALFVDDNEYFILSDDELLSIGE